MKKRETNFRQISLNDFDDDDGSSSSYGSSGIFIYMNVSTWCGSVKLIIEHSNHSTIL